ncbi:MAG TPA: CRISPR system precrRNA processing endoribonuclease RAMP protein Cas6 [Virgibacillus sp.]|nr:CRISPR system precrRNA processing endoribonuclease RAMP protein Cas6 [Virgibacillus sp.]
MNYISASIINIEIQSSELVQKPYPKYLHGLCYHLASKRGEHNKYTPPKFHPFISKWRRNKQGIEGHIKIAITDEILKQNMLETLGKNASLRLGRHKFVISRYNVDRQETVSLNVNNAIPIPDEFKICFITPTKFRSRNGQFYETIAYPDINLVIRSIARNLHILYGVEVTLEQQKNLVENVLLINAIGYPVQARIDKSSKYENSFVGELHLSCINLNLEQKKLLGLLLRSAIYTGVGHKKGYGYGHIKVNRLEKRTENNDIL